MNTGKVTLVAELGINCNGSLDIAKQLIDVVADAGCDYVKFQKRDIPSVYSSAELSAPRESPWGSTTYDQKMGLEFTVDQYREIDSYCKSRGIGWFVSCWDQVSLDTMEMNFPDMPFHKVASALAADRAFLTRLSMLKRPVILSTGMLTEAQIAAACDILGESLATVLHCTSTYPTKPNEMNMRYIETLATRIYKLVASGRVPTIGFSNPYSGLLWVPLAVAFGAEMLEFHVTLDRTLYGSDQSSSLEPEGVRKLVESVRVSQEMMGDGVKRVYDSELPIIKKLRKNADT